MVVVGEGERMIDRGDIDRTKSEGCFGLVLVFEWWGLFSVFLSLVEIMLCGVF